MGVSESYAENRRQKNSTAKRKKPWRITRAMKMQAKHSKQIRRETILTSHGDFQRSLYEVTIISIVKPQGKGKNAQNEAFWLFGA